MTRIAVAMVFALESLCIGAAPSWAGEPFLGFPLRNSSADGHRITSVFDHYMDLPYSGDTLNPIVAYSGEWGDGDARLVLGTCGSTKDCHEAKTSHLVCINGSNAGSPCVSNAECPAGSCAAPPFVVNNHYGASDPGDTEHLSYNGHPGIDFGAPFGTPLFAAAEGRVTCVSLDPQGREGCDTDYVSQGEVKIDHSEFGHPYSTIYLHLASAAVRVGQHVLARDPIGTTGATGTGKAHLHFEVRTQGGVPVDPYGWRGCGRDPYQRARNDKLWIDDSFDFAMLFFWISGNAPGDFFRTFKGQRFFPNDEFHSIATMREYGNCLHFRSAEAPFVEPNHRYHLLSPKQRLSDGNGDARIVAAFRANPPPPPSQYYGIGLVSESEKFWLIVLTDSTRRTYVAAIDGQGQVVAADPLSLVGDEGFVLLEISIVDSSNRADVGYSIDDVFTFKHGNSFATRRGQASLRSLDGIRAVAVGGSLD